MRSLHDLHLKMKLASVTHFPYAEIGYYKQNWVASPCCICCGFPPILVFWQLHVFLFGAALGRKDNLQAICSQRVFYPALAARNFGSTVSYPQDWTLQVASRVFQWPEAVYHLGKRRNSWRNSSRWSSNALEADSLGTYVILHGLWIYHPDSSSFGKLTLIFSIKYWGFFTTKFWGNNLTIGCHKHLFKQKALFGVKFSEVRVNSRENNTESTFKTCETRTLSK